MKHRVAVIEDDATIVNMYRFKLEKQGYDVRCAFNGQEGWELARSFRPHIMLVDLMMPEMTGDKMLEKIRQTKWGSKIQVIILTNVSKDEAPSSLRFLDVDRYIVKAHHTPAQVTAIVDEALRKES